MLYFGPFKILDRISNVAYRLELPTQAKIHLVFHVSLLKMCKGAPDSQYIPLLLTTIIKGPQLQPLAILNTLKIQICDMWVSQISIQWEGTNDYTWEFVSYIKINFQVTLDGEGNVMIKNTSGETSREHMAIDLEKDETMQKFVRRSSRSKKIPLRLSK